MYGLHKSQGALDFIAPTGPIFVTPSQCPEEVPGQDVMLEGYIRLRLERRRKVRSISIELKADAQLRSKGAHVCSSLGALHSPVSQMALSISPSLNADSINPSEARCSKRVCTCASILL